jgi:hypothetical protein
MLISFVASEESFSFSRVSICQIWKVKKLSMLVSGLQRVDTWWVMGAYFLWVYTGIFLVSFEGGFFHEGLFYRFLIFFGILG